MMATINTMVEIDARIINIIQRTRDVKSFRFKIKDGTDFKPGQFFMVTIEVEGENRTKHFSFSNSPTEKGYLEFTKRITGSPFSKVLSKMKKDDTAHLKLPYGNFTFEGEYEKIAMLSGGIGITPLRSMCKYITDKRLNTDVVLLYGNNTKETIVFKDDLDAINSANKNIKVIYTLTSPQIQDKDWQGRTGYIDDKMIKDEIPDFKERVFYICGPPAMVQGLIDILKNELSIQDDKIKRENFAGY